jgi:hypothetical protein
MIKACSALLVGIVAGALGVAGIPPAADAAENCRTRGRTVEANGSVRVFVSVRAQGQVRNYYGCDLARRRARLLGTWESGGQGGVTARFGLAGRKIAFEDVLCGDTTEPCSANVFRMDMRTGRLRLLVQLNGPVEAPPASDLLLTPNNTVVWIRRDGRGPARVTKVGADRQLVVLDPGPDVEPGSLATAGNRIYWTRGGVAQTYDERRRLSRLAPPSISLLWTEKTRGK